MVLLFERGHKKGILVVMQGIDRSLKIETKSATAKKKKGHIKSECYKLLNKNKRVATN